jgi:hypothetical protein
MKQSWEVAHTRGRWKIYTFHELHVETCAAVLEAMGRARR